MSTPRPPSVPTFTAELAANPKELARVLDQFARDVNTYARTALASGTVDDSEGSSSANSLLSASRSTALALTDSADTVIPCDTVAIDDDSIYNPTTGVVTIREAGRYELRFSVGVLLPPSVRFSFEAGIRLNAASAPVLARDGGLSPTHVGGSGYAHVSVNNSKTVDFAAGDELELVAYVIAEAAATITVDADARYTFLEVERVG